MNGECGHILVVDSSHHAAQAIAGAEAAMDDYLAKPIRIEELTEALGKCQPRVVSGTTLSCP